MLHSLHGVILAAWLCCRFELDDVMMTAIGYCGHSAASYTIPELAVHTNLQRLLLALPPVHRVRLVSLMVASVIHNR
jgi:hypothetical protein